MTPDSIEIIYRQKLARSVGPSSEATADEIVAKTATGLFIASVRGDGAHQLLWLFTFKAWNLDHGGSIVFQARAGQQ